MKFKELRYQLSITDRISICCKETLQYQNFITIKDVPELYNDLTVYGIGIIESEFYKINDFEYSAEEKNENLVLLSCVEIVVSQDDLQGDTLPDKIGIGKDKI